MSPLTIEVLLFGALKDAASAPAVTVSLHEGATSCSLEELLRALSLQHPALERYLPHVRIAINREYSRDQQQVQSGDEVALIPPVAGGCAARVQLWMQ